MTDFTRVDAAEFGAVADGHTDNTDAFQQAVDVAVIPFDPEEADRLFHADTAAREADARHLAELRDRPRIVEHVCPLCGNKIVAQSTDNVTPYVHDDSASFEVNGQLVHSCQRPEPEPEPEPA